MELGSGAGAEEVLEGVLLAADPLELLLDELVEVIVGAALAQGAGAAQGGRNVLLLLDCYWKRELSASTLSGLDLVEHGLTYLR